MFPYHCALVVKHVNHAFTGDERSGRVPIVFMEGDRPSQLLPYKLHLERHRVLRTKCMVHSMTYTTAEMGRLRTHVLTGLMPGAKVTELVEEGLMQLQVGHKYGFPMVAWNVCCMCVDVQKKHGPCD